MASEDCFNPSGTVWTFILLFKISKDMEDEQEDEVDKKRKAGWSSMGSSFV